MFLENWQFLDHIFKWKTFYCHTILKSVTIRNKLKRSVLKTHLSELLVFAYLTNNHQIVLIIFGNTILPIIKWNEQDLDTSQLGTAIVKTNNFRLSADKTLTYIIIKITIIIIKVFIFWSRTVKKPHWFSVVRYDQC